MKNKIYFFSVLASALTLVVLPVGASAAVGISPATAEYTLTSSGQTSGILNFSRDDEDTKTAMRIHTSVSDAFILTEGVSYVMNPGDRSIEIPYRIDPESYATGTYTAYLYVEPERIQTEEVVGNAVKVRGGIRINVTIADAEPVPPQKWYEHFLANAIQNQEIVKGRVVESLQDLKSIAVGLVRGV